MLILPSTFLLLSSLLPLLAAATAGARGLPHAADLGIPCRQNEAITVPLRALAYDAGRPGHVVAAAGDRNGAREISACRMPDPRSATASAHSCALRAIAWTPDHRPQAALLRQPRKPGDAAAVWQVERASAWQYASLAHLAVARDPRRPELCRPQLADPTCQRDYVAFCRGLEGGGPTPDQACLATSAETCRCDDQPDCRYPHVVDLAIDPGSGRVVAASDVGLLLSPDGGQHWQRSGVELRLARGPDLHATPERIIAVSGLRPTWQATGGRQRDGRPVGHWSVQVEVRWHEGGNIRSGRFAGKAAGAAPLVLVEQGR